jgi:hypothetical protein
MSESSLWLIDKENNGTKVKEYQNSWLFCPIVWNELMWKYMSNKKADYGLNSSYIHASNNTHRDLNDRINNSTNQVDRFIWEFSQAQVIFVKDKLRISNAIKEFTKVIIESEEDYGNHISERFLEIANDVANIPDSNLYFVIHGSSCDDNVEHWFYDNDTEGSKSLDSWDTNVCEFVIIDDDGTISFKQNLDFYSNNVIV